MIYVYYDANDMHKLYESITEIGCIRNIFFRENGLKVFLCSRTKVNVAEVYKQKAAWEKSIYG